MRKVVFIFVLGYFLIFFNFIILTGDIKIVNNKEFKHNIKNYVGNINIKDVLNTTVVQCDDNEFYLNHNIDGELDKIGSTFLDYRNNLEDKKLLIYGHNSQDLNPPFKVLEKYLDKEFYNNHSFIDVTLNNKKYIYQIFSVLITKEGDYRHTQVKFLDNSYHEHLNYLISNSIYNTSVDVLDDDYIITMQTCNYNPKNTFLLINAKRVKKY